VKHYPKGFRLTVCLIRIVQHLRKVILPLDRQNSFPRVCSSLFPPYCNICIEKTHLLSNYGALLASIEIENPSFSPQTQQPIVTPCANGFSGNEAVPCTGCKVYNECWMGIVQSTKECGSPLVFDEARNYCNFPSEVTCPWGEGCVESYSPTGSPNENSFTGAFVGCLILYISSFLVFQTNQLGVVT